VQHAAQNQIEGRAFRPDNKIDTTPGTFRRIRKGIEPDISRRHCGDSKRADQYRE